MINKQTIAIPPKGMIGLMLFLTTVSCSVLKNKSSCLPLRVNEGKLNSLRVFEREVLASCPISKGPGEVIKYLDSLEGFQRNKEYDLGNGSIRYHAKNAKINGIDLFDDKSLFLLNYNIDDQSYEGWAMFQAIYYYANLNDKENELRRILKVLEEELALKKSIYHDIYKVPYSRYTLPDGSRFNLKHGSIDNQHIINILWAPKGG
jgi:hypothetical protein